MTHYYEDTPPKNARRDRADDQKVPAPYKILMQKKRFCLIAPGKKTYKILHRCIAASEMGAHREALLFLSKRA